MSALIVVCFGVSAVLAALAAANVPSPRISLLAAAVAFLALGFTLLHLGLPG